MADKSILQFTELLDTQDTDVIYVVRGTGTDRDKHSTKATFLANVYTDIATNAGVISDIISGAQELDTLTVKGQTLLARDGGRVLVNGADDDGAYGTILRNNVKIESTSHPILTFRDIATFVWDIGIDTNEFIFANGGSTKVKITTSGIVDSIAGFTLDDGTASSPHMLFNSLGFNGRYIDVLDGRLRFVEAGIAGMGEFTEDGNFLVKTTTNSGEGLHVGAGGMRVTGTLGAVTVQANGSEIHYTRAGGNYLKAATSGGSILFITDGRANSSANANLILDTDQSVTVTTILNVDTIAEKTALAGISFNHTVLVDTIAEKTALAGISFSNTVKWNYYYDAPADSTEGEIYTALLARLINPAEFTNIHGQGVQAGTDYSIVSISRPGPTTMNVVLISSTGVLSTPVFTSGGTTVWTSFEIMSNFDVI